MSVIVKPTETPNLATIPSSTLFAVKAELERQNIKFVAKYVGTQILRKLGTDRFIEFTCEWEDFIRKYGLCLIEAYGDADDLHRLGLSFYVPRPIPEPKQPTPLEEAAAALDKFYEVQWWLEDSIEKGRPQEQINMEAAELLQLQDELNKTIDAAILYCDQEAEYGLATDLKAQREKTNAFCRRLSPEFLSDWIKIKNPDTKLP